ncbi:MAG: sulfide/dihydroorotate dehydrogenase-like FAD/NAD-binding protein [Candidatus Electryoneaceae bacterium]|nr:sulfide/dihydroorotate dehydrogenase-like FAD/NAD-binding protein [Candidatus Electryoneaceae bacterium]
MNKITKRQVLSEGVKSLWVESPVIARKRKAGQFVVVRINETGERIPLTIVDSDPEQGTIRLIFQEVGKTTYMMGELQEGDGILDVVGPLGKATHVENFGTVVCIGGGIGVAPVYPIAKAMKQAGNNLISIIGARNKELLILEQEMTDTSDRIQITTDDGSYGLHGFVTDALQQLIDEGVKIDLCVTIGPVIMMKMVSRLTKKYDISTVVSLNSTMIDATGMCGGCRVSIGDKTKFVCVDGPEFDGHLVNYDELMLRQGAYLPQEKEAMDRYHEQCRLGRVK